MNICATASAARKTPKRERKVRSDCRVAVHGLFATIVACFGMLSYGALGADFDKVFGKPAPTVNPAGEPGGVSTQTRGSRTNVRSQATGPRATAPTLPALTTAPTVVAAEVTKPTAARISPAPTVGPGDELSGIKETPSFDLARCGKEVEFHFGGRLPPIMQRQAAPTLSGVPTIPAVAPTLSGAPTIPAVAPTLFGAPTIPAVAPTLSGAPTIFAVAPTLSGAPTVPAVAPTLFGAPTIPVVAPTIWSVIMPAAIFG